MFMEIILSTLALLEAGPSVFVVFLRRNILQEQHKLEKISILLM